MSRKFVPAKIIAQLTFRKIREYNFRQNMDIFQRWQRAPKNAKQPLKSILFKKKLFLENIRKYLIAKIVLTKMEKKSLKSFSRK